MSCKIKKNIRPSANLENFRSMLYLSHGIALNRLPLIVFVVGLAVSTAKGQDLHFSQPYLQPGWQSPALSGVFTGDWRAAFTYRSQWPTVPVAYRTLAGSTGHKLWRNRSGVLSAGLLLAQDQAGDAGLKWSQAGVTSAFTHALSARHAMTLGFSASGVQRRVDLSRLTFKNQWDGDIYNPSLPSKETLEQQSPVQISLAAGLNWHWVKSADERTGIDAGLSWQHLNKPQVHFRDDRPFELPVRHQGYIQGYWQQSGALDYTGFSQITRMGRALDVISGAGMRYWLQEAVAAQFTLAARWKDALIPAVQLQWDQWTVGLSYDMNVSKFKIATQRQGGLEVSVIYTATPVKAIKEPKVCPIF